jgi:hypothetical protein
VSDTSIEDKWAIIETYSRFEQAVTDKDYDVMAGIFAEDAYLENRLGKSTGKAAARERFVDRFDKTPTTKIVAYNHLVKVNGDEARSSVDYIVIEVDPQSPSGLTLKQIGRYHDDWRREGREWVIYNRVVTEPS